MLFLAVDMRYIALPLLCSAVLSKACAKHDLMMQCHSAAMQYTAAAMQTVLCIANAQ